jgi:hypothetical protein
VNQFCNDIETFSKEKFVESLKKEFPSVFSDTLGKYKYPVKLHLTQNAIPVNCKKRPVALSVKQQIEGELNRLEKLEIITPVDHSEWAAPIVAVKKANGRIRICADFSTGLNDALLPHDYPMPTSEEIYSNLSGNSIFAQIDFGDAYSQLEVAEECKDYLVMVTHKGLFRNNRLPQGAKPSSGIFQQGIDKVLMGITGVAAFLDDVIIASPDLPTHIKRVREVLSRLQKFGFTIKLDKCSFFEKEIDFLGFTINKDGLKPCQSKLEVIKNLPEPTNISQLRSVLGSINHYSKFVPKMK